MCPSFGDRLKYSDSPMSIPDAIPNDELCRDAYLHAAKHVHIAILNHSLRVWLFAKAIANRESSIWTSDDHHSKLLFAACILHDVGACDQHDGPQRFEIEAADFAEQFLLQRQISVDDAREVWIAMALHSTPQIAERITPLARLVRLAVTIDFKNNVYMPTMTTPQEIGDFETKHPRLDIEKVLGDVVAEQAVRQPNKAPKACWPGGLYRWKLANPDWVGVNQAF